MSINEEKEKPTENKIIQIPKINIANSVNADLEQDMNNDSDMIKNINKLFLNNAQYSNKEKDYFISRFQIVEILKKCKIISKGLISKAQIDLILTKLNPHNRKYNINDFQNFLTELCHYIYKSKFKTDPKKTMNYFLNCLFNNYNDYLELKSSNNFYEKPEDNSFSIKSIEVVLTSNLERPICKLLLSLYESFKTIYKVYFPNELIKNINYNTNKELILLSSAENLLQFSKDFELVPYLVNKTLLNIYFNFLIKFQTENPEITFDILNSGEKNYRDIGIFFKLSSFFLFIYHFSILLYFKDFKPQMGVGENANNNNIEEFANNNVEKLLFFLQKLENSSGIKQYLTKKGRTNEHKFTFIPSNQNIEIATEEMVETIKDDNKYSNNNNLMSSARFSNSSRIVTDRIIENFYLKTISPKNSLIEIKNENFNDYFKDKLKNENDYLSLIELQNILSVSPLIKEEIINNIENLSEIFLKYSKIHDKLEYNRMTISSFIQFLKDTNILYCVPDEKRNDYRKISDTIIKKNYNISEVKKFDQTLKCSVSFTNINLSNEEKNYKKNVSKIVNSNNLKDKISLGEASLIFFSLTNLNNYPSNTTKIRTQFDKNTGYKDVSICSYIEKALSFDNKRENFIQKNIPNKMNLVLFIKSFELIATKLYPEMTLDDAVSNLLTHKILPFIRYKPINLINSDIINTAFEKMNNDPEIKNFLNKLGEILLPLYTLYSDKNGKMKFYQLFDFYKNFQLFPELISLSQMKTVFFLLCESSSRLNDENNMNKVNKSKIEEIDFSVFLHTLVISSMFFNFKDIISDIDRLLYICYMIWKSDGIKKQKVEENIPEKINRSFIELLKKYNKNKTNEKDMLLTDKINKKQINKSCSNPNLLSKKLILTYNNNDKEYICTQANRGFYKFCDVYN